MIHVEIKHQIAESWKRTAITLPDSASSNQLRVKTGDAVCDYAFSRGIPTNEIQGRAINDQGKVLHIDQ
jgi:hypothetical protein